MGFSLKKICITTYIIINNLTTISIEHMYYLIKSYVKYISYIVYEKRFVTFFQIIAELRAIRQVRRRNLDKGISRTRFSTFLPVKYRI